MPRACKAQRRKVQRCFLQLGLGRARDSYNTNEFFLPATLTQYKLRCLMRPPPARPLPFSGQLSGSIKFKNEKVPAKSTNVGNQVPTATPALEFSARSDRADGPGAGGRERTHL